MSRLHWIDLSAGRRMAIMARPRPDDWLDVDVADWRARGLDVIVSLLEPEEVSRETRQKLQESLVLVHGGMAQNVGPILEMVTEKYLLRSEAEWRGRHEALGILALVPGRR